MDADMESILSFYTWWPPEDDVAEGMKKSLDDIVSLGFTTISFDIQYHWLMKARDDWETLIGACDKRGLKIVPVVSYGFLPDAEALSKLTGMEVTTNITSAGENTDCIDPNDLGNVQPYVEYLRQFIDDYGDALYRVDGRTLLNFWEPSMIIWSKAGRTHLGYGQDMIEKFRRWALERCSMGELNDKWGTDFSPDKIQPPKVGLWDQDRDIMHIDPNPFWDDWCLFRAGVLARYYGELFEKIKSQRSVEIALGLSQHGVITQHDAYHQRCVYLPYWQDVPADKFIVSDDLYCK
jgi:hypothetical protein